MLAIHRQRSRRIKAVNCPEVHIIGCGLLEFLMFAVAVVPTVPPLALWHSSNAGDVKSIVSILHKSCEKQLSFHIVHCLFSWGLMLITFTVALAVHVTYSRYTGWIFTSSLYCGGYVFVESEHNGKFFCDFVLGGHTLGKVKQMWTTSCSVHMAGIRNTSSPMWDIFSSDKQKVFAKQTHRTGHCGT